MCLDRERSGVFWTALCHNSMSEFSCRRKFRFDHQGIKKIVVLLEIPAVLKTPLHGDKLSAIEGVCLLLERLTYPRKWEDLAERYDRHVSALSRILYFMLHHVMKASESTLLCSKATTAARLASYAEGFWRRGVPQSLRLWSVIDVKKVANCRLGVSQHPNTVVTKRSTVSSIKH